MLFVSVFWTKCDDHLCSTLCYVKYAVNVLDECVCLQLLACLLSAVIVRIAFEFVNMTCHSEIIEMCNLQNYLQFLHTQLRADLCLSAISGRLFLFQLTL